jgi:hypothetical protein
MTELISEGIWSRLKAAAAGSHRPAAVAVAYFGKGASKLLPLPKGSRLVVDASEAAVKSGQTCPAELKALMQKKGVRVYSVANLHAKVFVLGSTAFVGSANVSRHSKDTLVEAVVATTDAKAVAATRQFVRDLCRQDLGPEEVDRLQRMYRPPRMVGTSRGQRRRKNGRVRPKLPRLLLAHLIRQEPPKASEPTEKTGVKKARKRMEQPRRHELEHFWWTGQCPFHAGDMVMQILKEGDNRQMAWPPGNVVHTEAWQGGTRKLTFVYLEVPMRRRVALPRLAKRIGRGAGKRLRRGGRVSQEFAERLLAAWSD